MPTDCPQRNERLGWLGDVLAFGPTACFNTDAAAFFSHWLVNVEDAPSAAGAFPDVAPGGLGLPALSGPEQDRLAVGVGQRPPG